MSENSRASHATGRMTRRAAVVCLGAFELRGQPRVQVGVVATSLSGPYGVVAQAVQSGLERARVAASVYDLSARPNGVKSWLGETKPVLGLSLGLKAALAVAEAEPGLPAVQAMVLGPVVSETARPLAVLGLDPEPELWLKRLAAALPGRKRLGLLASPATPPVRIDAIQAAARAAGFTPRLALSRNEKELLLTVARLSGQVDVAWCAPDATLIHEGTVRGLVEQALQQQLPLIGFSESFVRAGAALGFYADLTDLGLQAAELAVQALNKQPLPHFVGPRKLKCAYNERVGRLLGLKLAANAFAAGELVVVR